MRIIHIMFWCLLLSSMPSFAQEKVKTEHEKQVKQSEVPHSILLTLKPILSQAKHVRHYVEKDSSNTFYEIKLKFQHKQLSIKFTENGHFYDLEETVLLKNMPIDLLDSIENYFLGNYINYKFKKVQRRLTSSDLSFMKHYANQDLTGANITYEVEAFIKLQKNDQSGLYEFLFTEEGALLEKSKIITREADYVLY